MENNVLITVRSIQTYEDNEPEVIELMTEGSLREEDGTVFLSYPESALTGLDGTQTVFAVNDDGIVLERRGKVSSRMEFRPGQVHKSLYESFGLGTLLITVCTTELENRLTPSGGSLHVSYTIEIEDSGSGTVSYDVTAVLK